jgi:hypothetical protein
MVMIGGDRDAAGVNLQLVGGIDKASYVSIASGVTTLSRPFL